MNTETTPQGDVSTVRLIYILYLVSFIAGITAIIGVVMAYVNKDDAAEWLQSHYQFIIHTFWKGLVMALISGLLMMVFIGFILIVLVMLWIIVRCVKGLKYVDQRQAHPDPTGWGF